MAFLATLALLLVVFRVSADTYLQQIPGSNNRLDDRNRDRENANRCFDSQNNNRGGYNVGNLAFYAGSVLHFSWTNQHSCGTKENHCELILQYACDTNIRDGTTHNTIPVNNQDCQNQNCDTDIRFCRHESFNSYQNCLYRKRNFRLFNSNQNLQGTSAIYTRQNPNGDRRGLECPEERDYYPYWQPTIWKDVAIFTNEPARCAEYKKASQNVQGRYYCEVPAGYMYTQTVVKKNKNGFIPITQEECLNATISYKDPKTNKTEFAKWTFVPAWNLPAPDCVANRPTRQNHLGNTVDGWPNGYNWTVTEDYADFCVFRLRYNISTYDFNGFASDSAITPGVDLNQNATVKNPDADEDPANLDIWTKYGLTRAEVNDSFNPNLNNDQTKLRNSREYVLKNNPRVDIFGSLLPTAVKGYLKLQLAINTAQYGRTFQDRSHRFSIKPLPSGHVCKGKTIYNLGVEGKRGNIVQTYPGTEYDFFPNELNIQKGQCIHIQWTGSNNNPDNNAGQGRTASDRHNIVLLRDANYPEDFVETKPASIGHLGNSYPRRLPSSDSDTTAPRFLGLSVNDLRKLAFLTEGARGHLDELDDAGTYYDAGPLVVNALGIYKYLCTRNNNFSNRGQKAVIVVSETSSTTATAGSSGVEVKNSGNVLLIQEGAVEQATAITFASTPAKSADASISGVASDFVTVSPLDFGLADGKTATLKIKFDDNPLGKANVYRADSMQGDWRRVKSSISGSTATVNTDRGGVYVVKDPNNYGAIFGVVIAILVVGGAVGFYFYRRTKANRAKASAAVTTAQSVKAAPAGGSPHAVSTDGDKGLPSGWQAVTDPHDGATYYVHATKGLSQWEVPTE